jgi:hypothetical protein
MIKEPYILHTIESSMDLVRLLKKETFEIEKFPWANKVFQTPTANNRIFILECDGFTSVTVTFFPKLSSFFLHAINSNNPRSKIHIMDRINCLVNECVLYFESRGYYRWLFLREENFISNKRLEIENLPVMQRYNTYSYGYIENNTFRNEDDFFYNLNKPYLRNDKNYIIVECLLKDKYRKISSKFVFDRMETAMYIVKTTYNTTKKIVTYIEENYPLVLEEFLNLIDDPDILFVPDSIDEELGTRSIICTYSDIQKRDDFVQALDLMFMNHYNVTYDQAIAALGIIETNEVI